MLAISLLAAGLTGCGTTPRPETNPTRPEQSPSGTASIPSAPADTLSQRLYDGWEQAFRDGQAMEGSAPDSVVFFRYQALLVHLDPELIPKAETDLRGRAQELRSRVAGARDSAWVKWQVDVTPPPEPVIQDDPHAAYVIKPVDNDRVATWLAYFTGPGRERFANWLWRSGAYRTRMEDILRAEGVPPELVAVVFIESGFSCQARSRARAVGPWQFVRDTARRYGLTVNRHRDERRDFELSTRAAARYLGDLYDLFGDWNLALAAYNCGEARVFRQISRQKLNDFWTLDLPRQTEDYVPEFHAVLKILAQPGLYAFSTETAAPLAFDEVDLPGPVRVTDLAEHTGSAIDDLKTLNPAWLRSITPADGAPVKARVPMGAGEKLSLASLPIVPAAQARAAGAVHRVRRGETLARIARRYGLSTAELARENGLSPRARLRAGRTLRLPDDVAVDDSPARASRSRTRKTAVAAAPGDTMAAQPPAPASPPRVHVVRRGESLSQISQRYGVRLADLCRLNGISNRSIIRAGQKLRLTG